MNKLIIVLDLVLYYILWFSLYSLCYFIYIKYNILPIDCYLLGAISGIIMSTVCVLFYGKLFEWHEFIKQM